MTKKSDKNMLIGLDIGTSKVVAIVGEVNDEGEIEIIGLGSHPSNGLKKGVVVNIESTVQSIQHAVEEAELMAGCDIHSVYTGIAGSHVRSLNSHGIVGIRDSEVSAGDVDRDGDIDAFEDGDVVWINDGSGAFTDSGQNLGVGGEPQFGDVDGDGDNDLLLTNRSDDDVDWLENINGDGSVWTRHSLDNDFDVPRDVRLGQGLLDVILKSGAEAELLQRGGRRVLRQVIQHHHG